MKNTFFLTLFIVPALSFAQALEGEFIRTPFWEAPFRKSHQIEVIADNQERLEKVCSSFSKAVESAVDSDDAVFLKRYLEKLRKRPHLDDWQAEQFEDSFLVKLEDLELVNQSEEAGDLTSSLPFYKQMNSLQIIDLDSSTKFEYVTEKDSLSAITSKVGLELENATVEYIPNKGMLFKVYSKDIACDLLNKKIALTSEVNSHVRPDKTELTKIEKFYQHGFMKEFSKVLKLQISDRKKAFLLGFRLGNMLIQNAESNERALIEKDFLNLLGLLLKEDSMSVSRRVSEQSGQFWIDQTLYQQDVKIHLTIK